VKGSSRTVKPLFCLLNKREIVIHKVTARERRCFVDKLLHHRLPSTSLQYLIPYHLPRPVLDKKFFTPYRIDQKWRVKSFATSRSMSLVKEDGLILRCVTKWVKYLRTDRTGLICGQLYRS
jgi:hypothetical protein